MVGTYAMLILMLFLVGAVTAAAMVVAIAVALLRPPRMTDGKAVWVLRRLGPGDLGLSFHDVRFNIRDERTGAPLAIAGWWIPHQPSTGKSVVLLHGYADAKVGAIAWAPLWRLLGYHVLAIDLRAHGESDGVHCTAGFWERHDVGQVLDQLRARYPDETRELALFGVSLGAATAAGVAALRSDISAVVLESPPADFRTAAMSHMDQLGAPGRLLQSQAISLAQRLASCDFDAVRPIDLLPRIACPVMIVAAADDELVQDADRDALRRALETRQGAQDEYWEVSTGHMLALHAEVEEYESRLRRFLHAARTACPLSPVLGTED